ncbi:(2Fe-2S) ferredoxin domain-containing protein [Streptomyces sp. NPDC050560]|uniref:(2Fe-2S) ferredoxin domain-containing protein n=1 Tax=Streptomyces sp. NPDC050560 TaxID=3365630 RepID=UPI0037B09831
MTPPDTPTRRPATLLVGMSLAEADRRDLLLHTAAPLGATVAFLQQADPSLSTELTRLADRGTTTVTLIGVRLASSGPAHSWLRRIAAHWWRERHGHRPELLVATRLADSPDAIAAAATATGAGTAGAVGTKPITGAEPGLTSAAWEEVTHHRHQVSVCRGPRCTAKGAEAATRALALALAAHGLGDDDVQLLQTGCQYPCNQAPVINVQPDDVWYGHVDPAAAERIVSEHLVDESPLATHRLPRHRRKPTPRPGTASDTGLPPGGAPRAH